MRITFLHVTLMALLFVVPTEVGATTIYLTSGTSWTVPSDWNSSSNTIEVIGGGANGVAGSTGNTGTTGGAPGGTGGNGGAGGGGGAYSKSTNVTLTPSASVTYAVGGVAGDTYLCNSTSNCASIAGSAVVVGAKGASGTTGGSSTSGVGSTKYSGGAGASGTSGSSAGGGCDGGAGGAGGGGGGAAGLHGAGNAGSGSSGGSGDAGNTAAGANGTQWSASYGSGGGAAGGTSGGGGGDGNCSSFSANGAAGGAGAAGGTYGAGGSGGKGGGGGSGGYLVCTATDPKFGTCISWQSFAGGTGGSGGALGSGRQGLIVITYTAALPSAGRDLAITVPITVNANVSVSANLSKGSGTFLIDHPLDPENKLLYHSFIESPDVLNEYTGTAQIGGNGEATIALPNYFQALNKDYQYFVRPIDRPMPELYVKQEVQDNSFVVGGGAPGGTISWMVTGVRHDPYILANPVVPEVDKGPGRPVDKGMYLFDGYAPKCSILLGCLWDFLRGLL